MPNTLGAHLGTSPSSVYDVVPQLRILGHVTEPVDHEARVASEVVSELNAEATGPPRSRQGPRSLRRRTV